MLLFERMFSVWFLTQTDPLFILMIKKWPFDVDYLLVYIGIRYASWATLRLDSLLFYCFMA